MEAADLYHQHHQLQEQLIGSSSLATTTPSFSTTFSNHNNTTWNPSLILLAGNLNSNGLLSNSSSTPDHSKQNSENILIPTSNSPMIQELGFQDHQWASINNGGNNFSSNHLAHELHLSRIKEEFHNKFSDHHQEFHFPSTSNYIKHHHHQVSAEDHDQFYSNNSQNCASFGGGLASSNRENFSQFFPHNLDPPCSSSISSSLDMNLQTLDLWNPATNFGGCSTQPNPHGNNLGGLFKQVHPSSFVLDQHMQESSHSPSYITNKIPTFMTNNGDGRSLSGSSAVTYQTKRSSSSSSSSDHHHHHHQPQSSHHHAVSKKPRTESCSSFPPFKVRKEKLGDRIAALQQLVAPFGKTDTASVLMEAIGYIKFLQDQVETLSVPYMKSTRNMARSSGQGGSCEMEGNKDMKRGLRGRGLCLVPLSCMSYMTNDVFGNFGGGT